MRDVFPAILGNVLLCMNWIVLVGFLILLLTPLASRPNSLADDVLHCFYIWCYGALVCS